MTRAVRDRTLIDRWMSLVLCAQVLDDYRRTVDRGRMDSVLQLVPSRISLAAAIELACWCHASGAGLDPRIIAQVEQWRQTHPKLDDVFDALRNSTRSAPGDWATLPHEVRAVPSANEYANRQSPFGLFSMRFARALRDIGGFTPKLAQALTRALRELVDNVLEHGSATDAAPCSGIVGYEVTPGRAHFAVGDTGRGVLASLVTNPRYVHLRTAKDALQAIIRDHATRRTNVVEGNGIKQVFVSLASLQGELRFRSTDAVLTVRGAEDFFRVPINIGISPKLVGLQVSVSCGTHDGKFTRDE